MVHAFYKYNSGAKEFAQISQRHFTATTDGIALKKEYQPVAKKKALI